MKNNTKNKDCVIKAKVTALCSRRLENEAKSLRIHHWLQEGLGVVLRGSFDK